MALRWPGLRSDGRIVACCRSGATARRGFRPVVTPRPIAAESRPTPIGSSFIITTRLPGRGGNTFTELSEVEVGAPAMLALARMPDKRALTVYLTGLQSKSNDLRQACAQAIGVLRGCLSASRIW